MWTITSVYFENLENDEQAKHVKKLTLNNEVLLKDPYSISHGWTSEEIHNLPDLNMGRYLYCNYLYLIETPSDFT